ncbi:hypothetical protein WA158_004976 [Blastocystis sp. Blastoise]
MYYLLFLCLIVTAFSEKICGTFSDFCTEIDEERTDINFITNAKEDLTKFSIITYAADPKSCYDTPLYGTMQQFDVKNGKATNVYEGTYNSIYFVVNNVDAVKNTMNCTQNLEKFKTYNVFDLNCTRNNVDYWAVIKKDLGMTLTFTFEMLDNHKIKYADFLWSYVNDEGCKEHKSFSPWIIVGIVILSIVAIISVVFLILKYRKREESLEVLSPPLSKNCSESEAKFALAAPKV